MPMVHETRLTLADTDGLCTGRVRLDRSPSGVENVQAIALSSSGRQQRQGPMNPEAEGGVNRALAEEAKKVKTAVRSSLQMRFPILAPSKKCCPEWVSHS
jgi:hypothetical protein